MFPRDLVPWCAQLPSQLQSDAVNTPGEGTPRKALESNHHHLDLHSNGNQGTELQSPSQNVNMLWGQDNFPVGIMDEAQGFAFCWLPSNVMLQGSACLSLGLRKGSPIKGIGRPGRRN